MSIEDARAAPRETFWGAMDKFPPYYVRLFAKKNAYTAYSEEEIAMASGITLDRVREIIAMDDWSKVYYGEILAFTTACNFDPTNAKNRAVVRQYEYACKKNNSQAFLYLRRSPKWESQFLPILKRLREKFQQKSAAA